MPLQPFSEDQILDRLRFENPWWVTGAVENFYTTMRRRVYFELFKPVVTELDIRRAVVLMGPRRVGKTVMLYHTIDHLLAQGHNPLKIAFVSVETPIYNNMGLEHLFGLCRKASGQNDANGWFVFFDEIQYLKDWEVHLKSLVDSYPNTRFIVSGSAAAALKYKSNESGAGRFTDFMLPPLTFHEYIHLKHLEGLITKSELPWNGSLQKIYNTHNIHELNQHFINYINYGGYPEVIFSEKIQNNPGRYIRSDIVDNVLLRDLPGLYGVRDVQELNSLFTAIAYNSGGEISLEELSKNAGIQKNTIKRYLEYLEAAFLIKIVHKISNKPKHFQRATQFKIYLTNSSLRSALFSPLHVTDAAMGNMVETAIFAQWLHRPKFTPYYARWAKGEVDMVKLSDVNFSVDWALEVKWSNHYYEKPGDLKALLSFMRDNDLKTALITTIDKTGIKIVEDLTLVYIPAAVYAYTVGRNTILHSWEEER